MSKKQSNPEHPDISSKPPAPPAPPLKFKEFINGKKVREMGHHKWTDLDLWEAFEAGVPQKSEFRQMTEALVSVNKACEIHDDQSLFGGMQENVALDLFLREAKQLALTIIERMQKILADNE